MDALVDAPAWFKTCIAPLVIIAVLGLLVVVLVVMLVSGEWRLTRHGFVEAGCQQSSG